MLLGPTGTRNTLALIGVASLVACASKKEEAPSEPSTVAAPSGDAPAAESSPLPTAPDAGVAPRDWLCSVLEKVPRGGRFGEKSVKKRQPKHAGVTKVLLRSNKAGHLNLAVLVEDDAENDRGLATNALSPPRALQAYRYQEEHWEDLGRPFQLIGWLVELDGNSSDGPLAYAVSTGIGDVRRALVASCEGGNWTKRARFLGKSFDAAALSTSANPDRIGNVSIVRGLYADVGAECKPVTPFGGGKIPVWLRAPEGMASESENALVAMAEPEDCRLPRKYMADQRGDSIAVTYEQCKATWGGDYLHIDACRLATRWFQDGKWTRLPTFEKLSGEVGDTRSAVAMGAAGPLVAVYDAKGLTLHQASGSEWEALPALPSGKACRVPIGLRSDPARIVVRTCNPRSSQITAYRLEGAKWEAVGGKLPLARRWGAQQIPSVAADWIRDTPYVAIGYYGAPLAEVYEGLSSKWEKTLETVISPKSPKNKAP